MLEMLDTPHTLRRIDVDVARRDITGWNHEAWDRAAFRPRHRIDLAFRDALSALTTRIAHVVAGRRNPSQQWWDDLTGPVDRRTARRLAMLGRRRVAAAGQMIVRRGAVADAFYLIEKGRVAISSPHSDDGDVGVPSAMLGPGEYFGEIATLHRQPPDGNGTPVALSRAASVHAVEECELRMLRRVEMLTLVELAPAAATAIRERAVGRADVDEKASVGV